MSIKIYNTQTRKKEDFETLNEGVVNMYVCGPTVYDFLHVGNFRGAVFYNALRNWLERRGYKVNYVYNYTDVDDKILNRAKEENVEPKEIAEKFIAEFQKDYKTLGLRPHTHNPRVTENIENIISFIGELIENNKAYTIEGDVYYDVMSFDGYGKLSNKNLDELQSGHRIEVDNSKKNPMDFALWKSAKPGEQSWTSPWGEGRPGWHIECSAMSRALLGDSIDIHGGGLDLMFPHHENELAQSEGCTGKQYVKYWVHNNMIEFGNQKMSKSLGNIRTGRSFLEEYNAEIFKFMVLNSHYRSIMDFSDDQVARSIQSLAKFYSAMSFAKELLSKEAALVPIPPAFEKAVDDARLGFAEAMDDDFNTAEALSKLFELTRAFNNLVRKPKFLPEHKAAAEAYLPFMVDKGSCLALFEEKPQEFLTTLDDMLLAQKDLKRDDIDNLVKERIEARTNKDYQKSDEIRDKLVEMGVSVMDNADGISVWEVTK